MREYQLAGLGCCLRYVDLPGEETPILFIHGLGCAGSFDYPEVAAQAVLAKHRRILVDLLGAGYSDSPPEFDYSVPAHAAYLKEFVDGLGVRDVVLFGHSLGGPVAIELAKLCGSRVRALVLSEANLDPSRAGSGSYQIAQLPEEEFAGSGMGALIAENRANGNTMWAAALSHCAPTRCTGCPDARAAAETRRGGRRCMNCLCQRDLFSESGLCRMRIMRSCGGMVSALRPCRPRAIRWRGRIPQAWQSPFPGACESTAAAPVWTAAV